LRKTRAARDKEIEDEDLVPKRSARLAAKSRYMEAKPKTQARKVMMKNLGFEVETELPDETSFDEFQTAFRLPLTPSKREAMQVLFLRR
jgi:DNA-dependent RNA polymerase auxiliary subunit epsilon